MKHLVIAALCALLPLSAAAQPGAALDPAKREARIEAAERYIKGPAMQEMFNQMLSADTMMAQMQMMPQVANADRAEVEKVTAVVVEMLAEIRPQMEATMVDAAAQVFTLAELQAANEFYESPEGKSMAMKTNQLNQAVFATLGPVMQNAMMSLPARLKEAGIE